MHMINCNEYAVGVPLLLFIYKVIWIDCIYELCCYHYKTQQEPNVTITLSAVVTYVNQSCFSVRVY